MSIQQKTASDRWDMGFAELIEEMPLTGPDHKTPFRETEDADPAHIYMLRRRPSWADLTVSTTQYPR